MKSMISGAASLPTSATATIRKSPAEFIETFPEATKAIRERYYVDDYLDSVNTVQEAKQLKSSVIKVHKRGGSMIPNWSSNNKDVL